MSPIWKSEIGNSWKTKVTIIEIKQLTKEWIRFHIQMCFFYFFRRAWTSGGDFCSLSDLKTAASSRAPLCRVAACRTHQWAFSLSERDNLHLMGDDPVMNRVESSSCAASSLPVHRFSFLDSRKFRNVNLLEMLIPKALLWQFNLIMPCHAINFVTPCLWLFVVSFVFFLMSSLVFSFLLPSSISSSVSPPTSGV